MYVHVYTQINLFKQNTILTKGTTYKKKKIKLSKPENENLIQTNTNIPGEYSLPTQNMVHY